MASIMGYSIFVILLDSRRNFLSFPGGSSTPAAPAPVSSGGGLDDLLGGLSLGGGGGESSPWEVRARSLATCLSPGPAIGGGGSSMGGVSSLLDGFSAVPAAVADPLDLLGGFGGGAAAPVTLVYTFSHVFGTFHTSFPVISAVCLTLMGRKQLRNDKKISFLKKFSQKRKKRLQ